ncbi:Ubiquitin carboxyl-terminal hydrolase 14 [Dirofilaria immitis]|nr:Ubiquitin carboxyl-terminal hydrolase 14 [Dirofilaria immitis]
MVRVFVKWGKERFEVDANVDDSPLQLKSQLFSLTGVNPERQKVLVKGKILGDNNWDGCELKDGMILMMIGSGGLVPPPPPANRPEDNSDDMEAETSNSVVLPAGLKNLGNTCYLNATLQCFKVIPELREALSKYSESIQSASVDGEGGSKALTAAVRDLYRMMDNQKSKSYGGVIPLIMIQVVHNVLPQFATRDEHGWMQQDANECWTELLRAFQTQLKVTDNDSASKDHLASIVSRYMEGRFKVEMKNLESDIEPISVTKETFYSQEVKYVQLGIKSKLTEEIMKKSAVLGRDAKYEKKTLIDRLPAYLSIQMVRFFYKEKDKVNAKILKDVKFPLILDLYDMCTPELQQELLPARGGRGQKIEIMRASKTSDGIAVTTESDKSEKSRKLFLLVLTMILDQITVDITNCSSGHYVAWVRVKGNHWAMCDDDEVHPVSTEDILKLSGGVIGIVHTLAKYFLTFGPIPEHIAFIMDGNRRYARSQRYLSFVEGHREGFDKLTQDTNDLLQVMQWCREIGVKEVTVYALKHLPLKLRQYIAKIELLTREHNNGKVNVCIAYTAQDEIRRAVVTIAHGVQKGLLTITDINECLISRCLDSRFSNDPDLLIRTSGETRLSDFLLWQCSKCHVYFDEVLWPNFDYWNLCKAIYFYQQSQMPIKQLNENCLAEQKSMDNENILEFLHWADEERLKGLRQMSEATS